MRNNGIKNFVYSFILSMLAIVAADKFVQHAPHQIYKEKPQKLILTPQVSLFADLKEDPQGHPEKASENADNVVQNESAAVLEVENKIAEAPVAPAVEDLMPPPPKSFKSFEAPVALVLDDDQPSESPIVYTNDEDPKETIPLEQGERVTYQDIQSASSAALTALNWLSEPVYSSNLDENKEEIEKFSHSEHFNARKDSPSDNPWVMASANRYAKNQMAVEKYALEKQETAPKTTQEEKPSEEVSEDSPIESEDLPKEEISAIEETFQPKLLQKPDESNKLAYKMIQNLLIPIPEEIMSDTDLTPQLSYSPHEKKMPAEKAKQATADLSDTEEKNKNANDAKSSGLFKSISSWFSKKETEEQSKGAQAENQTASKNGKNKRKIYSGKAVPPPGDILDNTMIMPAELRLSFQPNRAEISGNSLQWLRAFADNARENDDVFIEVRFDTSGSANLQKKRLKLLSKIFADRGVDFRKINVVGTTREPNSLIVRNIRLKEEIFQESVSQSSTNSTRTYY